MGICPERNRKPPQRTAWEHLNWYWPRTGEYKVRKHYDANGICEVYVTTGYCTPREGATHRLSGDARTCYRIALEYALSQHPAAYAEGQTHGQLQAGAAPVHEYAPVVHECP